MFKLGEGSTAILGHAVHGPTPIETNSILADSNTKLMFWDTSRERELNLPTTKVFTCVCGRNFNPLRIFEIRASTFVRLTYRGIHLARLGPVNKRHNNTRGEIATPIDNVAIETKTILVPAHTLAHLLECVEQALVSNRRLKTTDLPPRSKAEVETHLSSRNVRPIALSRFFGENDHIAGLWFIALCFLRAIDQNRWVLIGEIGNPQFAEQGDHAHSGREIRHHYGTFRNISYFRWLFRLFLRHASSHEACKEQQNSNPFAVFLKYFFHISILPF